MQDWSKYIERPIVEVLPELEAEGYRVTSDECVIFGQRNIKKAILCQKTQTGGWMISLRTESLIKSRFSKYSL